MTNIAKAIRTRREITRNQRELMRAINTAPSPSAREDLIAAMQRAESFHRPIF